MFTGIIQELGTVAKAQKSKGLMRLAIRAPKASSKVRRLESISVNGVCLSVVGVRRDTITFDVIRETQKLTTLGEVFPGERVNLEPSLSMSDRLNGHFVFGHVDGMGAVTERAELAGERRLVIRISKTLRKWLVSKGPVALDGVSMTVGSSLTDSTFIVHLIPETLRKTTLGIRDVGDYVNIEIDYLAKLVRQFVRPKTGRRKS